MTSRKFCTCCSKMRLLTDFNLNHKAADGHQNWCRTCSAKNAAAWTRRHREQHNESQRRHRRFKKAVHDSMIVDLLRQAARATAAKRASDPHAPAPLTPKLPDRVCNVCGVLKPLHAFTASKTSPDGHKHVCEACFKLKRRRTRARKANRKEPREIIPEPAAPRFPEPMKQGDPK